VEEVEESANDENGGKQEETDQEIQPAFVV
jgi:hypothetical protein